MTDWATPDVVRAKIRRRWDTGRYLTAVARGEPFDVVDLPIRGPRVGELGERFDEVSAWAALWHKVVGSQVEVVFKTVGGRKFGVTELPDRVRITSLEALVAYLGEGPTVRRYRELLKAAESGPAAGADGDMAPARPTGTFPANPLWSWVADKPIRALSHAEHFEQLLAAVYWIAANAGSGRRLREIDVAGVDTKFIERHHRIVLELAELVVDPDLVRSGKTVAARFGFATSQTRVRFRMLDLRCPAPFPGFDDVEVRTVDLDQAPIDVRSVYIIENLATYLAFPEVESAVAIFGSGYAAASIGALRWLRDREVYYWGDIDTHGYAILDRVRVTVPHARSLMMDRATLLANKARWGQEPKQVERRLAHLTDDETAVYEALLSDEYGESLRLEQERIPMDQVVWIS